MNNRMAFIDFVRGLLNINPLERWSPQQAKLHPFITQQKFTGPFVPPMNLKSSALTKTPAPGVQQQLGYEAEHKQQQQAAQQTAQTAQQTQAQMAAQSVYAGHLPLNAYPASPQHAAAPPVYNAALYSPHQQGPLPPYPGQPTVAAAAAAYAQQPLGMMHSGQMPMGTAYGPAQAHAPQNLYAQATTRAGRQRAATMDQQQGGIPAAIQRVASHLDPNAPIRLQPSPAYYPPPPGDNGGGGGGGGGAGGAEGGTAGRRRGSRAQGGSARRNFVQNLEDRTLEEGFMNQASWH